MNKTVVITGASRGLGLAMTVTLVHAGYSVIAIARKESAEIARLISEHPDKVRFCAWDLADITSLGALAKTIRELASGTLWGLVNNAGIGTAGVLSTFADNKIEELIRLNIVSPITLTKYLVRPMMATRGGRIVSVSSIVASTGYSGLSVYSATKAALVGFTHSLAREVGPLGITVNVVAPGFVTTDMTDGLDEKQRAHVARRSALKRLASAEDVASTVDFLMSDRTQNITGTILTVDAGNTA